MTIALLELAAARLGDLVNETMFVGGATLEALTTDPAAPPARPTDDVDLVIEATTRGRYELFADRLRARALSEDSTSRVICRWRDVRTGLVLDVMPTEERVFGFANHWYADAFAHAGIFELPSGARVRVISAPFLLATKFEAFADRGRRDPLASRDLADMAARALQPRSRRCETPPAAIWPIKLASCWTFPVRLDSSPHNCSAMM